MCNINPTDTTGHDIERVKPYAQKRLLKADTDETRAFWFSVLRLCDASAKPAS